MRSQLAILCVMFSSLSLYAADAPPTGSVPTSQDKVLILPFEAVNSQQPARWIARGVQQSLLAELASMRSVAGIAGAESTTDVNKAIEAAKSAEAKYVVFGSYQLNGDSIRFTGQVADASGKILGGLQTTGPMRDLFGIEDSLGNQLRGALANEHPSQAGTSAGPATRPAPPTSTEPRPVYAWDRDEQTDFGAHDRYPYYRADYYNRRLWDNYQAYWDAYYSYNYIPGFGFPYFNNVTIIQPTDASPTNAARPSPQAVGNVPGPIQNTMQGAPPNTMRGAPRNSNRP